MVIDPYAQSPSFLTIGFCVVVTQDSDKMWMQGTVVAREDVESQEPWLGQDDRVWFESSVCVQ